MFLVEDVERVERAVCLWAKVWLGSHCNVVEEIPPGCNAGGLLQRRQLGTSSDGDFEFHHPVDLFVGRVLWLTVRLTSNLGSLLESYKPCRCCGWSGLETKLNL